MTPIEKAVRAGSRQAARMTRDARKATANAVSGGEMLQASGDVIAARLEIMAAGAADPRKADLKEMALMSSEKVEALSAAAAATARNFGDLGGRLAKGAMQEATHATRAASAMASASTPAALAAIQFNYATGWWSRAVVQALTLNTELLKVQADALKPVRDAAMANALRLKKR